MSDRLTPIRIAQIEQVFSAVVELPASERAAFLRQTCGDDVELRREIDTLVEHASAKDATLDRFAAKGIESVLREVLGPDTDKPADALVGQTISHFTIEERLGWGGMGVVYRARDTKLDRMVALKFLPPSLSANPEAKQRFIHEAKAASALDHVNITTTFEIGETGDERLFIAMALHTGETLKQKIKRFPLPVATALDYAAQLAEGLSKAHAAGIVHRDLKPANVMVTAEGIVKLLDFGIAKLTGDATVTRPGTAMGTVAYMSPEQARGEPVDHRTDIWSLGVVLYEMLTGRTPFSGDHPWAMVHAILENNPESAQRLRPELPTGVAGILGGCLEKNPAKRYQSAEDLLADLRQVREALEPAKRRGRARGTHQARRRRIAYLAAGVAIPAVIFGVMAVISSFTVREPETPETSIAVLPFENRSDNPEDVFFTDGIHVDLLTLISHIRDIKTISHTSVMQYRENRPNLRTIGEELGVTAILEGGVQRASDQVRINVQLIDAATDAHLWAATYTRELTAENVFRIQSEIASEIAEKLQVILSPEEQQQLEKLPTTNLAALEAYFKGNALGFSTGDVAEAIGHFQRAIELDPKFALAYCGLALSYLKQVWLSGLSSEEQTAKAEPLIDKALELDPLLSEGYAVLGYLRMFQDDPARAEAAIQRAIELNPNDATAYGYYARFLAQTRHDFERALVMQTKREELDPEAHDFKYVKAEFLSNLGRIDEARAILENLVRDYPENAQCFRSLGWLYRDAFGRHDEAVVVLRRAHALDPRSPVMPRSIASTYQRLGATEEEVFWLERDLALAPESNAALGHRVRLHTIKGELAEADALWKREWELGKVWTGYLSFSLQDLMNADFAAGRVEAPRARYFKAHPQWFEPNATIPGDFSSLFAVADVARSLIATGEQRQANFLLGQIDEKLEATPASTQTWRLRVYAEAVKGDAAVTMRAIHAYVAFAGRPSDLLYAEPMLGLLQSDPDFQAVFGDVAGRHREQLARIRAMEAAGELAPVPPLPRPEL